MKKIFTVLLVSSVVSTGCFAKGAPQSPMACDYSDYFHLANDSITNIKIDSLTGDDNIIVAQKDDTSFSIKDTPSCPADGGVATVRYQKDSDNYCDLKIHDAENFWHPEVEQSTCHGDLHYSGMKYDGVNTYSYSLSFY